MPSRFDTKLGSENEISELEKQTKEMLNTNKNISTIAKVQNDTVFEKVQDLKYQSTAPNIKKQKAPLSCRLHPDTIEYLNDIVVYEKISGNIGFTLNQLIGVALKEYIERPENQKKIRLAKDYKKKVIQ